MSSLAGCHAVDPALLDPDGRPLSELRAVSYLLAVAPLDESGMALDASAGTEGELAFAMDRSQFQARLVAALQELNAASAVVAVGDKSLQDALDRRADLLVRPRLRVVPSLGYESTSDLGWSATLLWLTWIGGLYVDASRYRAEMALDFEVVNPHDGLMIDSFVASSDYLDLSFLDRNSLWSWAGLQSLFLPAFWTSDDAARTSLVLSGRLCERLGGKVTRYLKFDLGSAEREFLGELRLTSPLNGADVGPIAQFSGKVVASEPITDVAMFLNDGPDPILDLRDQRIPPPTSQRRGNLYQVFLNQSVHLAPGENRIAVEIRIAGRLSSRTLRLYNGAPAMPPMKTSDANASPRGL